MSTSVLKRITVGPKAVIPLAFLVVEAVGGFISVYDISADNNEVNIGRRVGYDNYLFKIFFQLGKLYLTVLYRFVTVSSLSALIKNLGAVVDVGNIDIVYIRSVAGIKAVCKEEVGTVF